MRVLETRVRSRVELVRQTPRLRIPRLPRLLPPPLVAGAGYRCGPPETVYTPIALNLPWPTRLQGQYLFCIGVQVGYTQVHRHGLTTNPRHHNDREMLCRLRPSILTVPSFQSREMAGALQQMPPKGLAWAGCVIIRRPSALPAVKFCPTGSRSAVQGWGLNA